MPVSMLIVDIFEPRSKLAIFALKSPTVPLVTSLLVGPVTLRLVLRVPAASEAPFGRWIPSAGRKASRSRAGRFSPSILTFRMVSSAGALNWPDKGGLVVPIFKWDGVMQAGVFQKY